jgi:hypothetical protein
VYIFPKNDFKNCCSCFTSEIFCKFRKLHYSLKSPFSCS